MNLPTVFETREPRADVLKGTIGDTDFAADLAKVTRVIEHMGKEEAAHWLGVGMQRKNPRRGRSALCILPTVPRSRPISTQD